MNVSIEQFKRSNKIRREKLAVKYGYKNVGELLKAIQAGNTNNILKSSTTVKGKKSTVKVPTIHNVHILDASGSMMGKNDSFIPNCRRNIGKAFERKWGWQQSVGENIYRWW